MTPRTVPLADGAGAGVAIACALHCLLTPWLITVLPLLAPAVATERTEGGFLAASLSLSGATLLAARLRIHACWRPVVMFTVAALAMAGARALGVVEQPLGQVTVLSAAGLITVAHCANVRCCRDARDRGCNGRVAVAIDGTVSPGSTGDPCRRT
jgi:hypothetical protein